LDISTTVLENLQICALDGLIVATRLSSALIFPRRPLNTDLGKETPRTDVFRVILVLAKEEHLDDIWTKREINKKAEKIKICAQLT